MVAGSPHVGEEFDPGVVEAIRKTSRSASLVWLKLSFRSRSRIVPAVLMVKTEVRLDWFGIARFAVLVKVAVLELAVDVVVVVDDGDIRRVEALKAGSVLERRPARSCSRRCRRSSRSSTPVTVTVWGIFQFAGVKTRSAVETRPSVASFVATGSRRSTPARIVEPEP